MKTAVSIPDSLFAQAETAASQLDLSRSEFYAQAIAAYLRARQAADVTKKLDQIYGEEPASLDPDLALMQAKSLPEKSWRW